MTSSSTFSARSDADAARRARHRRLLVQLRARHARAALYEPALRGAQLCLSFQSVAELRLWALAKRWGEARRQSLDAALSRYTVLPYDDAMSHACAGLTAHRRRLGRPIETGDAWIAASALRHNATLLTHNGQHYADIPDLHVVSHRS